MNDFANINSSPVIQPAGIPLYPDKGERKWIKKSYNRTGGMLLMFFVLTNVVSIVGVLVLQIFARDWFLENVDFVSVLLTAVSYVMVESGLFLFGGWFLKFNPKSMFSTEKVTPKFVLKSAAITMMISMVTSFLTGLLILLLEHFDMAPAIPDFALDGTPAENITLLLYGSVLGPIVEELLFRGVALKGFSKVSNRFGIIMSSICFGLMHGNLQQFIFATAVGLALGTMTVKSNSLIPAIIVHVLNNSISFLQGVLVSENEVVGSIISVAIMGVSVVAGLAVSIFEIVKWNTKNTETKLRGEKPITLTGIPKDTPAQKKRTWGIFFTSVTCWLYLILYVGMIILTFTPFGESLFL